jgi:thioredoxin reductase
MARIAIVGDGPGGLSAALFLARGGHDAIVFGMDSTAMHYALLNNYLGIDQILGSEFQTIARAQASAAGARVLDGEVTSVVSEGSAFIITTAAGDHHADYLVLTEGQSAPLADSLGVARIDEGVDVDRNGRTSIGRVYVVGRSARPTRSQAVISAGDGAVAALDILSREAGKDVQDWDSPPKN